MLVAVVGTGLLVAPWMVIAPFVFAADGRIAWALVFGALACAIVAFLALAPFLGYRIDDVGIASREGIPPRFTETTRWSDVRLITWNAAHIPRTADNCIVWAIVGGHRSKRLRWLLEAQAGRAGLHEVQRCEAEHGPLQPMLVTLSHLSRRNHGHLLAAFEREGFDPLPEVRLDYATTVSRRRPTR
jgi:hypothetical protein